MTTVLVDNFMLDRMAREIVRTVHEVLVSRVEDARLNHNLTVEAYIRVREALSSSAVSLDLYKGTAVSHQQVSQLAGDLAMIYFIVTIVRIDETGFECGLIEIIRKALLPVLQKHISTTDLTEDMTSRDKSDL